MKNASVAKLVQRQVRVECLGSVVKVFMTPMACAAALGLLLAGLVSVPMWVAVGSVTLVVLPVATWAARRTWRQSKTILEGRQALLVNRWISAAQDPVEASRRREIYRAHGLAGSIPLIESTFAKDVIAQLVVKGDLRFVAARKAGPSATGKDADWSVAEPVRMLSANGLMTNSSGMDSYGDIAGSSLNHDRLFPAHNPNTDSWTSGGTYSPPH